MFRLDTPVALFVFNRPEQTRRVFRAIAAARPSHLLLVADGPRTNRAGEDRLCDEVKRSISSVDWPCKVETNFSNENLGCRRRIISGLDWVFSVVEEAILLEDDCIPDPSFFPYCSELLERYRNCEQVGLISGYNPIASPLPSDASYFFTRMVLIWGWATWRRTWMKYDEYMSAWPTIKDDVLRSIWPDRRYRLYWETIFESMHRGVGPDTWDYQLVFTSWAKHWLNIIPRRNLVENIGFGEDATHTKKENPLSAVPAKNITFPLIHPSEIVEWSDHPRLLQSRVYSPDLLTRAKRSARIRLSALTRSR
jgi:hypothetical protein